MNETTLLNKTYACLAGAARCTMPLRRRHTNRMIGSNDK